MSEPYQYKAFISYSHADNKWGQWLHRAIETYRTPKLLVGKETAHGTVPSRLSPVFRDRDDLASAADLSDRIDAALSASENLVLICSPNSAKSPWVNKEVEAFKKLGRSNNIFCVIVAGDPGAVGTENDCFPPAIRERYDSEGNRQDGPAEPIAADLRKEADGKSLAKLKVLAGLLNVNLDDLRQREIQRKQRRMIAITSGSIAATAITVVLAINATLARNEADQRRTQAEDLLGFMVGDLRSSLEPIGRLDLLESVGQQAMEYYRTVSLTDLSEEELVRQAQVMTQIGEIRFNQLQYEDALSSFSEAYERSAELQRKDPTDSQRLFNRSQAEFWIGFVYRQNGDLGGARDWLTKYRDSALLLHSFDTSNTEWTREVAYGYHNLGVLDEELGALQSAKESFNLDLELLLTLREEEYDPALERDIADTISWLGSIAIKEGQLGTAFELYGDAALVMQSLSDSDASNSARRFDLAFAIYRLAEIGLILENSENSAAELAQAVNLFSDLAESDRANINWRRAAIQSKVTSGYLLLREDRVAEARSIQTFLFDELGQLQSEFDSGSTIDRYAADVYLLSSWIENVNENFDLSLRHGRTAIEYYSALSHTDEMNEELVGKIATAYILTGISLSRLEQEGSAEQLRIAGNLLENRISLSSSHYLLDPWLRYLIASGLRDEAENVSDVLESRRYIPLIPWQ
ncbi:MAG: hypothetical protein DHS20C12_20890 [Pseudohongiella sp.]|nr:MAG: hypothetical protein DHS20C12_20890 [Pseudohongiella sp.]